MLPSRCRKHAPPANALQSLITSDKLPPRPCRQRLRQYLYSCTSAARKLARAVTGGTLNLFQQFCFCSHVASVGGTLRLLSVSSYFILSPTCLWFHQSSSLLIRVLSTKKVLAAKAGVENQSSGIDSGCERERTLHLYLPVAASSGQLNVFGMPDTPLCFSM